MACKHHRGKGKCRACALKKLTDGGEDSKYGHKKYEQAKEEDLVTLEGTNKKIHKDALPDWLKMVEEAQTAGINLNPYSTFRDTTSQHNNFYGKMKARGITEEEMARSVAPPGHSEHHTGYTLDINSVNSNYWKSPEGQKVSEWLQSNAGNYNFNLSFPEGNDQGVMYEPWHWRWEGNDTSKNSLHRPIPPTIATGTPPQYNYVWNNANTNSAPIEPTPLYNNGGAIAKYNNGGQAGGNQDWMQYAQLGNMFMGSAMNSETPQYQTGEFNEAQNTGYGAAAAESTSYGQVGGYQGQNEGVQQGGQAVASALGPWWGLLAAGGYMSSDAILKQGNQQTDIYGNETGVYDNSYMVAASNLASPTGFIESTVNYAKEGEYGNALLSMTGIGAAGLAYKENEEAKDELELANEKERERNKVYEEQSKENALLGFKSDFYNAEKQQYNSVLQAPPTTQLLAKDGARLKKYNHGGPHTDDEGKLQYSWGLGEETPETTPYANNPWGDTAEETQAKIAELQHKRNAMRELKAIEMGTATDEQAAKQESMPVAGEEKLLSDTEKYYEEYKTSPEYAELEQNYQKARDEAARNRHMYAQMHPASGAAEYVPFWSMLLPGTPAVKGLGKVGNFALDALNPIGGMGKTPGAKSFTGGADDYLKRLKEEKIVSGEVPPPLPSKAERYWYDPEYSDLAQANFKADHARRMEHNASNLQDRGGTLPEGATYGDYYDYSNLKRQKANALRENAVAEYRAAGNPEHEIPGGMPLGMRYMKNYPRGKDVPYLTKEEFLQNPSLHSTMNRMTKNFGDPVAEGAEEFTVPRWEDPTGILEGLGYARRDFTKAGGMLYDYAKSKSHYLKNPSKLFKAPEFADHVKDVRKSSSRFKNIDEAQNWLHGEFGTEEGFYKAFADKGVDASKLKKGMKSTEGDEDGLKYANHLYDIYHNVSPLKRHLGSVDEQLGTLISKNLNADKVNLDKTIEEANKLLAEGLGVKKLDKVNLQLKKGKTNNIKVLVDGEETGSISLDKVIPGRITFTDLIAGKKGSMVKSGGWGNEGLYTNAQYPGLAKSSDFPFDNMRNAAGDPVDYHALKSYGLSGEINKSISESLKKQGQRLYSGGTTHTMEGAARYKKLLDKDLVEDISYVKDNDNQIYMYRKYGGWLNKTYK
jgi:hypothetical protein